MRSPFEGYIAGKWHSWDLNPVLGESSPVLTAILLVPLSRQRADLAMGGRTDLGSFPGSFRPDPALCYESSPALFSLVHHSHFADEKPRLREVVIYLLM